MPSKLYSVTKTGISTQTIEVETDVSNGMHSFNIVGLGDKTVEESKERISSALKNSHLNPPRSFSKRVTINLAPADIKKEGGLYDLPMAAGFLLDSGQVSSKNNSLKDSIIVGELGLDGNIRPVKGVLLYTLHAKEAGFKKIIVPSKNLNEASLVKGIEVIALSNIKELIEYMEKGAKPKFFPKKTLTQNSTASKDCEYDFALIKGQEAAKQALEIAAAGGHNILLKGPPGSGKTLLAKSTTTILPSMSYEEALDVTKIQSVIGVLKHNDPLVVKRPFRSPHHTSSESAIIGGGAKLNPGEITLAHRGVLFMDEFPEFHRNVLESLRQPLEEGSVVIARARGVAEYPAYFMLIAAANPCPCGYYGDKTNACSCTTGSIVKYQRKLSGPIADRIDLHVHVPRQNHKKISSNELCESSVNLKKRVEEARKIQLLRFKNSDINLNSEMHINHIKKYCRLDTDTEERLGKSIEKYKLSARAYHSILKVSRTIADLEPSKDIKWVHVSRAIQYARRDSGLI